MIAVSDFLPRYWWVLAHDSGVLHREAAFEPRDQGRMWLATDKLTRSPLKRLHQVGGSAQFASTMATMLTAGLPLVKCLEVTANVIGNDMVAVATRKTRQGVEQGRGLAECMAEAPISRKLLTEMTGVGEHPAIMEEDAHRHRRVLRQRGRRDHPRLLSLMEPCITIALAIITVMPLLAVYLPLFTMYGSIA